MRKALSIFFLLIALVAEAQITRVDSVYTYRKSKMNRYQNRNLYSYTLGLKVFSIEEFPKILNQTNTEDFRKTYWNGLVAKFNDNQISYRLSASFFSEDISFENECKDCQQAKGHLTDNAVRAGFEKSFVYADIQPYFAGDIGFRRNNFKGRVDPMGSNTSTPFDVATLKNGLSMSPSFGIKFNIIDHFTLAVESSIDLLYSYEKQEKTYYDAGRSATFNQYRKWEFLLKPVSRFSLQYNFGLSY